MKDYKGERYYCVLFLCTFSIMSSRIQTLEHPLLQEATQTPADLVAFVSSSLMQEGQLPCSLPETAAQGHQRRFMEGL